MIIKPYSPSKYITGMSDLLERLSPQHPQYARISKEIGAIKAGDYGEKIVYKELEQTKLPYECYIFHKMFLFAEYAFELDFLIITPYGAVILEVKNIIGELEFSTNPSQLIQRKEDGKLNKYPCPANQLSEYKYQLSQFFRRYNMSVPIHGVVIFASRNSFITQSVNTVKIIYRNEIRSYLRSLPKHNSTLSNEQMEKIKEILLSRPSSSPIIPLIDHFSIPFEDLKLGVKCECCGFIGMQKIIRTWYCPACKKTNSDAHHKAISTYFSLCKETITNKECREFLLLNNRHEAKRILSSSLLIKSGNSAATFYKLPCR
ncbi:nuclease-related domain-containing protein [Psychrobacillus sp. BM2]|uniref:nuclease-related domain-containing protein n=1 Tax=Psychrobacillus sp. BM2 TaxID=3400421 RepID=UPI003B02A926